MSRPGLPHRPARTTKFAYNRINEHHRMSLAGLHSVLQQAMICARGCVQGAGTEFQ